MTQLWSEIRTFCLSAGSATLNSPGVERKRNPGLMATRPHMRAEGAQQNHYGTPTGCCDGGGTKPRVSQAPPWAINLCASGAIISRRPIMNYEFKNFFKLAKAELAYARFFFFLAISSIK